MSLIRSKERITSSAAFKRFNDPINCGNNYICSRVAYIEENRSALDF